jgi:spermidine dehydrogenase
VYCGEVDDRCHASANTSVRFGSSLPTCSRSGFDASRDIAGIILNRWGHAYASPAPGFYFGKDGKPAPGDVLRAAPFGRIAFANVDLSGMPDHKSSIIEGNRAVEQVLDQVLRD